MAISDYDYENCWNTHKFPPSISATKSRTSFSNNLKQIAKYKGKIYLVIEDSSSCQTFRDTVDESRCNSWNLGNYAMFCSDSQGIDLWPCEMQYGNFYVVQSDRDINLGSLQWHGRKFRHKPFNTIRIESVLVSRPLFYNFWIMLVVETST